MAFQVAFYINFMDLMHKLAVLKSKLKFEICRFSELEAEGQAQAVLMTAQAQAKAIALIAEALGREGGPQAAQLAIAKQVFI